MTGNGIHIFDSSVQEANHWLKALMDRLNSEDPHLAHIALRGVLHALRDRVGPDNAVHLGAQLPVLIRGLYYEGWHFAATPTRERHRDDFLNHVRMDFPKGANLDAEKLTRAVFDLIWGKIAGGQVTKIIRMLPEELRDLWPRIACEEAEER